MASKPPSYATIVRQGSSDATSPRLIVSPSYSRSMHSLNRVKSNSSTSECTAFDYELQQQPNSTQVSTPKRHKRRRKNKRSMLLSTNHPQQKDLLIIGYIRRRYPDFNNFPKDLIRLLLSFYDEIIYWKIKGEQMDKFKSMKNGAAFYGPKFKLFKHIHFETTLCPNGWKSNQNGAVQFYIELKRLPSYISSITVYYELSCKQTASHCKKIRIFRKATDAQSWGSYNMRLLECETFKELEFASLVKILRIEYKNEGKKRKYIKDFKSRLYLQRMKLKRYTVYEWSINERLLQKFKNCKIGKFFYSPSFGYNSFCLELAPQGWHKSNSGKIMLYLRLLKLPKKIKQIMCECEFKSSCEQIPGQVIQTVFSYGVHGLQWSSLATLSLNELQSLNNLKLLAKIRIIQVININDKKVAYDHWNDYDILCNHKC